MPNSNPFNPQQQQPAVIQTPFGPIANPRANQPLPPNGAAPVQPVPFGSPAPANPFGANTNPNGQNQLFGNVPPIFTNPGSQPR
jgi:hypothetical protein